jgi:hypothetical protein
LSRAAQALLGALAGASSASCASDRQPGASHPETAARSFAAIEPSADASPVPSKVDEPSDAGAIADGAGIPLNVDAGDDDAGAQSRRFVPVYGGSFIMISQVIPFSPGSAVVPTQGAFAVLACTGATGISWGKCRWEHESKTDAGGAPWAAWGVRVNQGSAPPSEEDWATLVIVSRFNSIQGIQVDATPTRAKERLASVSRSSGQSTSAPLSSRTGPIHLA